MENKCKYCERSNVLFYACNKSRCKDCYRVWLQARRAKIRKDPVACAEYRKKEKDYRATRPARKRKYETSEEKKAARRQRQRARYKLSKLNPEFMERKRKQAREGQAKRRAEPSYRYQQWYQAQVRLYGQGAVEMRDSLLAHQDSKCSICKTESELHLDHDHKTGQVRGLLCPVCNRGLGAFRDSPAVLSEAIGYLLDPPASRIK